MARGAARERYVADSGGYGAAGAGARALIGAGESGDPTHAGAGHRTHATAGTRADALHGGEAEAGAGKTHEVMIRRAAFISMLAALAASTAFGQAIVPTGFTSEFKVSALAGPVSMAFLPDGRLFIIEQVNRNMKLWTGSGFPITVATIPHVRIGGENGLLGIAIDPRWPAKPYVYLHYNHYAYPDSSVRIARFTCTGDLAFTSNGALAIDPADRFDVLAANRDEAPFHNGGTLRFGPDGMLYASFGDDGNPCAAQDTTNLNGKILRLDIMNLPDGAGGPPALSLITPADNPFGAHPNSSARLVYALGLRNPFRFHIDRLTGDLFVGDVGDDGFEEIDYIPAGGGGGLDFGWPWREGFEPLSSCPSGATGGFSDPIWAYDHNTGLVVISAGLYRRNGGAAQFPMEYEGDYFFADYYTGELYRLERVSGVWQVASPVAGQPGVTAWGTGFRFAADWTIGPDGALWWCDQQSGPTGSRVHRIFHTPPTSVDTTETAQDERVLYDLQGRRVEDPQQNGLYFTKRGKKRLVLN